MAGRGTGKKARKRPHVVLRVPVPRVQRRSGSDSPLAEIVHDSAEWERLQRDPDHELLRSGAAVSLAVPIHDKAPLAFTIDFRQADEIVGDDRMEAKDGPFPAAYRHGRLDVRWIDGRLFAPFQMFGRQLPTEIGFGFYRHDEEELREMAREMAEGGPHLLAGNPFLIDDVAGHRPHQDVLDDASIGRGLYRGATPAERMVRSAAEDFALIEGIVHRRVHDPVLGFTSREGGAVALSLPLVADEDGLRRFRHDNHADAEAFFAVIHPRRRDGAQLVRCGRMTDVDPAYRSGRDDARLAALDAGKRMLAATSLFVGFDEAMPPRLLREWYRLRAAVEVLDQDDAVDPALVFEKADDFAHLCAHRSDGLDDRDETPRAAVGIVARVRKLASRRRGYLPKRAPGPMP